MFSGSQIELIHHKNQIIIDYNNNNLNNYYNTKIYVIEAKIIKHQQQYRNLKEFINKGLILIIIGNKILDTLKSIKLEEEEQESLQKINNNNIFHLYDTFYEQVNFKGGGGGGGQYYIKNNNYNNNIINLLLPLSPSSSIESSGLLSSIIPSSIEFATFCNNNNNNNNINNKDNNLNNNNKNNYNKYLTYFILFLIILNLINLPQNIMLNYKLNIINNIIVLRIKQEPGD